MRAAPPRSAVLGCAMACFLAGGSARAELPAPYSVPDPDWTTGAPPSRAPPARHPAFVAWTGLRFAVLRFHASDSSGTSTGFAGGLRVDAHLDRDLFTASYGTTLELGGGSGGFAGDGRLDLAVGLRGTLAPTHGPFARLGGRVRAFGNDNLLFSDIALPSGEVGYQLRADGVAFDVGARSALLVAGRWGTEAGIRRSFSPAPDLGGFGWLVAPPLVLRAEWQHILPSDAGGALPLDVVEASACTTFPGASRGGATAGILVCVDAASFRGGVYDPGAALPREASVTYGGFSVGIGGVAAARANE